MLQVYLYGPKQSGWLDITPGTVLDVEELHPMFDEDYSTGIFTLPADFPWTENNRRLFGFSERIENLNKKVKEFKCDVYDSGWPEMLSAKLTILEKSGTLSYRRGKFSCSIAGTRGLFGSNIRNKKLRELYLGGPINFAGSTSREFATSFMFGNYPQYEERMAFAPVAIENFFDTGAPWYQNEFLAKDTVNTLVINGALWEFGRPESGNPTAAAAAGTEEYIDYRTVPFYKMKYVLRKVFEEHDYKLTGDFIDSTDWDDLVLFNNYGIEHYFTAPNYSDVNHSIIPRNHVPDMLVSEFIKFICSGFGIYMEFNGANEVRLVYRKDNLRNRSIISLTPYTQDEFTAASEETEEASGYRLNYAWDGNDSYYSERVKEDMSDKTLVATVTLKTDLTALNIGRGLTTNDIAYVTAENMFYVIIDATNPANLKWSAYAEKLTEFKKGDGERTVDISFSTLCTYCFFNDTTSAYERQNYVGTRQPGSFRNHKGTIIENEFGLRLFYIKKITIGAVTIPVSFNHNRHSDNTILEKYSLALHGDDGLVKNLQEQYQDVVDRIETVKVTVNSSRKLLAEMDAANTIEINNVLYLPYKRYRTIPHKNDTDKTAEVGMDLAVL